MKSILIATLLLLQTTAFAQTHSTQRHSTEEIITLLQDSAERSKLLWYDDVISANSVIMVGWIVNGTDLTASCEAKSDSEEICHVASQVILHTMTARGNYPVTKEVRFRLVNGVVTGDITMTQ